MENYDSQMKTVKSNIDEITAFYQSQNLCNDFMFGKVLQNVELLRELLEMVLNIEIERLESVVSQMAMKTDIEARGIRIDVYAKDLKDRYFSVEMQMSNEYNIPKRSRYYHSTMDSDMLNKGQKYRELGESYVIFFCTFDLFGQNRFRYTFRNSCDQDHSLLLNDGITTVILNTRGTVDTAGEVVSYDLKQFLRYLENSTDELAESCDSDFIRRIHKQMQKVRLNKDLEVEYLTLLEREEKRYAQGLAEGMLAGKNDNLRENIQKMKAYGMDDKKIAEILQLSEKEVKEMQAVHEI